MAAERTLEVTGLSELEAKLKLINGKIARKIVADGVRKGVLLIKKEAKLKAPSKTGTLRKAIKHRVRRQSNRNTRTEGRVFVEHGKDARHDAFYARFVERGTQTGYAVPEPQHLDDAKPLTDQVKFFGRQIEHPGTPKQAFMRPAIERMRRPAIMKMREEIRRAVQNELKDRG